MKCNTSVKDSCSENFVIFAEKCQEESRFFLTKLSTKYDFLEIYQIFNVTNSTNLDC